MANYAIEFSQDLGGITPEEKEWLEKELDVGAYDALECDGAQAKYVLREVFEKLGVTGFNWSFEQNHLAETYNLWIHTEESGMPEPVAALVQAFLKKFRPDDCWYLEFAQTCSSPRPGAFGGGAVFVTGDEQLWMATGQWAESQVLAHGGSGNG